jgi:lysophospholipase L1-like esterase
VTTEVGRGGDANASVGRPPGVEAYVRGCAWPAGGGATYPRANPADFSRLPIDTWATAQLPVGVRLEVEGSARAVEIEYHTETDDLGYRGEGAGKFFTVIRDDLVVDEQPAVLGPGSVQLSLGESSGGRAIIYLPEGMKPTVDAVRAVDGEIAPPPKQPRWLCYGDSVAEGWIASGPAFAWPAIAGRIFGLDGVNLGYAGSARGELVSAEHIAGIEDADVISISHGTNCWTRIQHSAGQMLENTRAFLEVVRAGHPGIPIVICSPVTRPDAEATANSLGATLVDLRAAMETATQERIDAGDELLTLVSGAEVLTADQLPDGIHPGDGGHLMMAEVFGGAIRAAFDGRG